jgi:hypothetical protein
LKKWEDLFLKQGLNDGLVGPGAIHSPGALGVFPTGETLDANRRLVTGIYVVNNLLFFISNKDVSLKFSSRAWDSRKAVAWQGIF